MNNCEVCFTDPIFIFVFDYCLKSQRAKKLTPLYCQYKSNTLCNRNSNVSYNERMVNLLENFMFNLSFFQWLIIIEQNKNKGT